MNRMQGQCFAEFDIPDDQKEMKEEFQWPEWSDKDHSKEVGGSIVGHIFLHRQPELVQKLLRILMEKTVWGPYRECPACGTRLQQSSRVLPLEKFKPLNEGLELLILESLFG